MYNVCKGGGGGGGCHTHLDIQLLGESSAHSAAQFPQEPVDGDKHRFSRRGSLPRFPAPLTQEPGEKKVETGLWISEC